VTPAKNICRFQDSTRAQLVKAGKPNAQASGAERSMEDPSHAGAAVGEGGEQVGRWLFQPAARLRWWCEPGGRRNGVWD
jgi:hypothetical protein